MKPHIILIPGAWHSASSYDLLIPLLKGYDVTALTLPSVGAEPPVQTLQPEIDHIRSILLPLLDAGTDILVVMHSYAGVAGSSALQGLSKSDRQAQQLPGGVTSLVYLCAWMVPVGQSVRSAGGGQGGKGGPKRVRAEGDYIYHVDPIPAFYHDVDPQITATAISNLKHHSLPTFFAPQTYAAFKHIPTTYLVCEEDNTIPCERQLKLIEEAGTHITTFRCSASHSPFLSQPQLVAQVIRHAAGEVIEVETSSQR